MPRFDAYLTEVQQRMNLLPTMTLIRAWTPQEIAAVEAALRAAVAASGVLNSVIPNFVGTNQSKGNKAANHFIALVPPHLPAQNQISLAKGAGYPDRIYVSGQVGYCMEFKATSNWQNADSNRRVLTSAPTKMRRLVNLGTIGNPPAHLICTVLYSEPNSTVTGIRLDFLDPSSIVNIRLEASTSQRLLAQSPHHNVAIP